MNTLINYKNITMSNNQKQNTRPPIITITGHIDHGKTTLLNYIRNEKNPEKEHGGITQHFNAYNIKTKHGNMTFIDTPGHFAFNSIRIKSVQHTDIMVLVVALDDGIKPQTIESIEIAKKYNIPIIVAINKIDKLDSETKKEKLITELSNFNLIPESWGGDTFFSFISSKTGEGIQNLIDVIHLQADMLDLKSRSDGPAEGVIVDNTIDQKKGTITSVIILNGKLKKGDFIKTKTDYGKIKLIIDNDTTLTEAIPSMYVKIIGLSNNQEIGERFESVKDKQFKKHLSQENNQPASSIKKYSMEDLMKKMVSNEEKKLNLIIKSDVQGSLNALKDSINNLSKDNIKTNIIKMDLGSPTQSDIELAITTKSFLIGFNVKTNQQITKLAQNNDIKINTFNIIYDVIDYINELIQNLITQNQKENIIGTADVKRVFIQDKNTVIAGCVITQGKIKQTSNIKIFRKNNLIYKGNIESIKIFKNIAQEVSMGNECGISIKDYNNIQINDKIKAYTITQD